MTTRKTLYTPLSGGAVLRNLDPVQTVLDALHAKGHKPKLSGDEWSCTCPAHDDRRPSFNLRVGDNGGAVVHCHKGCSFEQIVAALGLEPRDLMPSDYGWKPAAPRPNRNGQRNTSGSGATAMPQSVADANGAKPRCTFPTLEAAVAHMESWKGERAQAWLYVDEQGDPRGATVRLDGESGKDYKPLRCDGGSWSIGGMPTPRPLYRLDDLCKAPEGSHVYVVEGEKAADALRSCELVATTTPHGNQSPGKADWTPLRGHDVVILPDNDEAGENYAEQVVDLAHKAGARSVRIVRLVEHWPALPKKGDAADVLDLVGGDTDAVRAAVEELAAATEPEIAPADAEPQPLFDISKMFPPDAVFASNYFVELSRSTQTPVEMSAMIGMAIASACVANVAQIRGHGDHIEPAQLWVLVLSDPGTRKSAVFKALQQPVLAWESEQAKEMKPEIAAAIQRHKITEKRLKAIEDRAAKERDPSKRAVIESEAVAVAQELGETDLPKAPVLLASEPTPEALSLQMADNMGRALLASAEGDALDIIQGRYTGSRNYGIMLKGHAGDAVRATRVGRPGDVIDLPALAVALCVQPAAIEEIWSDKQAKGRGLLARFAVCAPANRIGSRDVRPIPVDVAKQDEWRRAIGRMLTYMPSDEPETISLSDEADAIYNAFQVRTEKELGCGGLADRREWGGKLCGLALRFALTLHAIGTWSVHGTPAQSGSVSGPVMSAAIEWARYLMNAERHAREQIQVSDEEREQMRLVDWIMDKDGAVTARELSQGPNPFRGNPKRAQVALDALVECGRADWIPAPGGRKLICRLR